MPKPTILALAGSTRTGSFNGKALALAAAAATEAGAEMTVVNLKDYVLPLYDADFESEQGLPDAAKALKALFVAADGLLIASPEYNSSITPLLKNTLDWVSRAESDDEAPLQAFSGKTAALISASPGALGGLRGLVHLRAILGNIGVLVLHQQAAVSSAHTAIGEGPDWSDAAAKKRIASVGKALAEFLLRYHHHS